MTRLVLGVLLAAAVACDRRGPTPTPAAAPAGDALAAATSTASPSALSTSAPSAVTTTTPPPRPAPPPATAILEAATAVEPGGRLGLAPGAETTVHPSSTFEVKLTARAADARLVLVDARDDLVPASATREVGDGTRLTLAPAVPLVPGSRYALRLDGAVDRELHDAAGRAYAAVTLPLLAAGTPPPPEPKRKPAGKRKRP